MTDDVISRSWMRICFPVFQLFKCCRTKHIYCIHVWYKNPYVSSSRWRPYSRSLVLINFLVLTRTLVHCMQWSKNKLYKRKKTCVKQGTLRISVWPSRLLVATARFPYRLDRCSYAKPHQHHAAHAVQVHLIQHWQHQDARSDNRNPRPGGLKQKQTFFCIFLPGFLMIQ